MTEGSDDPAPPPPPRRPRRKDPLGPDSAVGLRLRALFAEDMRAPLPADILDLLEQLDEAERRSRS